MRSYFGKCDWCGKEAELTNVEGSNICPECLKEYACCDKCGGYFSPDVTPAYHLRDGRIFCEDCAVYDLNSGDLDEDDIDHVDDPEEDEE